MQRDIRHTALFKEADALYRAARHPGTGQISDAAEISVSRDGTRAVFTGTIVDQLEGTPTTRICRIDLQSGDTRVLTFGPNTDRSPKFSPDGTRVAFLSDRHKAGDFQLYWLDLASGAALPAPVVEGWVEYFHWSPDSRRIVMGVAGYGADVAAGGTSKQMATALPSWTPRVETGEELYRWRGVWVCDVAENRVTPVRTPDRNVWEAGWCGNDRLAAVVSTGPGEGMWYGARVYLIDVMTAQTREVYAPRDQVGGPSGSPSGLHLAFIEAVCSDRWYVAGELRLVDTKSSEVFSTDTRGVDITHLEWRSDGSLLLVGHRGFETVVGLYDVEFRSFAEKWASVEKTTWGRYAAASGFGAAGDCVLVGEGFVTAPEVATIHDGEYRPIRSFDLGTSRYLDACHRIERVEWQAPDGLQIQGWLLCPERAAPYPLIMNVHGGPVWHWRPNWLGRNVLGQPLLMLLKEGYAIFLPNPRGSSGRGQSFARHVVGDMGGADTHDYLSGLDHLVERGIADPARLGVTGISYGGFMTSWLITQDARFRAAVSVSPFTNQVTHHLVSNVPHFVSLFLADHYTNPDGRYFQRSPIMHARNVKTPTLNICGALDRCTPPEEAVQFHNALRENGVKSVLVTYPEEWHGVRKLPATIDYTARLVAWFKEHVPATGGTG